MVGDVAEGVGVACGEAGVDGVGDGEAELAGVGVAGLDCDGDGLGVPCGPVGV